MTMSRSPGRTRHAYALKGMLFHDSCGRRMQGNWAHEQAWYRCRFPQEYALANSIDHPLSVYLREADILGPLDAWLAHAFAPTGIEHALAALEEAQPAEGIAAEAAHRTIAECDRKLARHRAALEAGADPALVATWSREVQAQRAAAEATLRQLHNQHGNRHRMSREEIEALVDALGGLLSILQEADPADKAEVYRQLGLRLTYDHETRTVLADSRPAPPVGVVVVSDGGGDLSPRAPH
jgi:site-specific DNA recombinase